MTIVKRIILGLGLFSLRIVFGREEARRLRRHFVPSSILGHRLYMYESMNRLSDYIETSVHDVCDLRDAQMRSHMEQQKSILVIFGSDRDENMSLIDSLNKMRRNCNVYLKVHPRCSSDFLIGFDDASIISDIDSLLCEYDVLIGYSTLSEYFLARGKKVWVSIEALSCNLKNKEVRNAYVQIMNCLYGAQVEYV